VLRGQHPALRYGRQYFRPCSGNGNDFGYSPYPGGVIAFSRILNDRELLVVANAHTEHGVTVHVVIDTHLNAEMRPWRVLFSTVQQPTAPAPTAMHGASRTVQVTLAPMEAQVLG
jgi:hypothetical protein